MNYEDFMKDEELDVQKAVVETLAAEKAELDLKITSLNETIAAHRAEITALKTENEELKKLKILIDEMKAQLSNVGDILARNTERPVSNQIALLDRNENVLDRFDGETRDHVLEVIADAQKAAEADGRLRRAQLLEAVLAANEPLGLLAKKRNELNKLFDNNAHVINGQVINSLDNMGIHYKDGENYLLTKEIVKRTF